jgi:hypothetical protein
VYNSNRLEAGKYAKSTNPMETVCSVDALLVITFDYSQRVHLLTMPDQVGSLFFLCPPKCAVFGVVDEGVVAVPKESRANYPSCKRDGFSYYLAPEPENIEAQGRTVISMVDHWFERNYGGQKRVIINADNCCGQNKNRHVIAYMALRVALGLHTSIVMDFMVCIFVGPQNSRILMRASGTRSHEEQLRPRVRRPEEGHQARRHLVH